MLVFHNVTNNVNTNNNGAYYDVFLFAIEIYFD